MTRDKTSVTIDNIRQNSETSRQHLPDMKIWLKKCTKYILHHFPNETFLPILRSRGDQKIQRGNNRVSINLEEFTKEILVFFLYL